MNHINALNYSILPGFTQLTVPEVLTLVFITVRRKHVFSLKYVLYAVRLP